VREVSQAGWAQTTADPADIVTTSGDDVAGVDFGNFELVTISGVKFEDTDGDGERDAGESDLPGWTIQLLDPSDDNVIATDITDATGAYSFTSISPGSYRVREVNQTGWAQTTADPADIVTTSGDDVADVDFGNFELVTISGTKFEDTDGDGERDAGESGLSGWTIQLLDSTDDSVIATAITDATGAYSFASLAPAPGPGSYRVREVSQAGWAQTTADPADIVTTSGDDVAGVDFGNFELVTISGTKFEDIDGDGERDAGESGLSGWTIQLLDSSDDSVIATAITDATGAYGFVSISSGSYRVREVSQPGWTQTTADPADITLLSGQDVAGVDFGNKPATKVIGRHVFYNGSAFDGDDGTGEGNDDAIAPGKWALLPGETASSANYTNYTRGLNGVMIDIQGLAHAADVDVDDFEFRLGNDDDPANWSAAPVPASITISQGGGTDGSDRVMLIWADGAISEQWLEVTVKPTVDIGLLAADVAYFGNAIGDVNSDGYTGLDDALQIWAARRIPGINPAAPIDYTHDINRDGWVGLDDALQAWHHRKIPGTHPGLHMTAPAPGSPAMSSPPVVAPLILVPATPAPGIPGAGIPDGAITADNPASPGVPTDAMRRAVLAAELDRRRVHLRPVSMDTSPRWRQDDRPSRLDGTHGFAHDRLTVVQEDDGWMPQ
jgi:hypothetical protein